MKTVRRFLTGMLVFLAFLAISCTPELKVENYIVSFDAKNGTEVTKMEVVSGTKVAEPAVPVKDGYDFLGWYLDSEKYDFDKPVTKDIVLTAKWKEKKIDTPPVDEPDDPVDEPDNPIDEPDNPIDEPDNPVDEPDDPIDEPDDPADKPDDPVVEPDDPVVEPEDPAPESSGLSSVAFAKALTIGWNLGNTLDANGIDSTAYAQGLNTETFWGMPMTTEAMIKAVHEKGFETIRIPVSWHNHISKTDTTDYKIDDAWMARVKEIVDWAYNDGMYVILNIHHDNLSINDINSNAGFCVSDDAAIKTKSKNFISKVWTQIATEFKGYSDKLVFEVLNEPRDMGGLVFGGGDSSKEFNPTASGAAAANVIIKEYEQVGLDAIRAVKGNENRFVMVPAYAASPWQLSTFTLPSDTATDKLLVSTHAYDPYVFAMGDTETTFQQSHKDDLNSLFYNLKSNYTEKGIGVVMGEGSATDKGNLAERIKWAEYYFTKAYDAGIPVILWDNMVVYPEGTDAAERHGHFNRRTLSWFAPTLIEAMVNAANGNVTIDDDSNGGELLESAVALDDWSLSIAFSNSKFFKATASSSLKIVMENIASEYNALKFIDKWADTTLLSKGTVSGATKNLDGVFSPNAPGTMIYTPTEEEWNLIKAYGFIIQGFGVKITSINLVL